MKSEEILRNIGDAIKKKVPFEAVMPSEKISPPTVGDLADCTDSNTIHVDEFLYDKDEFEEMTQKKKIQLHYCVDCNSRNIKVSSLNWSHCFTTTCIGAIQEDEVECNFVLNDGTAIIL